MTPVLRGLRGRVILAAMICAGLAVALVAVVLTSLMIDQALKRIGALAPQLDALQLERCERDPAAFVRDVGDELDIHLYGPDLRPTAPDAPPVDSVLLARLQAGERAPSRMYYL